jgi:hypothetical protein
MRFEMLTIEPFEQIQRVPLSAITRARWRRQVEQRDAGAAK